MDGALKSLDKLLSMKAFNSMVSMKFGVVVCHIFPMMPFQLKTKGGVELGQLATALVPMPLVAMVEPSMTILLAL